MTAMDARLNHAVRAGRDCPEQAEVDTEPEGPPDDPAVQHNRTAVFTETEADWLMVIMAVAMIIVPIILNLLSG